MNKISILGSTGSIGTQTLQVCRDLGIGVAALSAGSNIDLLERQVREFNVPTVSVYDPKAARVLRERLQGSNCVVYEGQTGNCKVASAPDAHLVVTAMTGMIGLEPTLAAISAGKDIALANKETLVCAGQIVMKAAREKGVRILPVDSEHSAVFQCLNGAGENKLHKLLLTASGGPFYQKSRDELRHMTAQDALKHPNWSMGAKITVDSATLMNKGLEWIEAKWLFDLRDDQIEILVHRESIVHSAVEFEDHSVIAQMGVPSMYLPIKYALTYPKRVASGDFALSLIGKTLHFDKPDEETFGSLKLAKQASKLGGLYPTLLNGANEQAVALFLKNEIKFLDIEALVRRTMEIMPAGNAEDLECILQTDRLARETVLSIFRKSMI